jgi:hypothetical protein
VKSFDNEWIFEAFEGQSTFFTKRMFGGLAAYLFGRLMLILVEPTKSGRWQWHGVLIGTDHERQPAIVKEFPALGRHDVLQKWLYIDSRHDDFESTLEGVARAVARNDPRFGVQPLHRKAKAPRRPARRVNGGSLERDPLPPTRAARRPPLAAPGKRRRS